MSERKADRPPPGLALEVEILRREGVWPEGAADDDSLARALQVAFGAAGGRGPCEVAVILTGDGEIRALNREWRGKDSATNVLSFPLDAPSAPGLARPLGDIVLAWETVEREAREKGIAAADHATHLVLHGLLHILGFGHDDDAEARCMEQLETRILADLGIADPHADEREEAGAA